jgi:hypothetical protein
VSYGRTEQGHQTIAGELIDGAFIPVDLVYENPKTPVHDLMDIFRIEILKHGRGLSHIHKQHCHELAFTFDGTTGREDLFRQMFGGVGLGLIVVDGRGFFGRYKGATAFIAEIAI